MAEIPYTEHIQDPSGKTKGFHWPSVTESDTCQPVRLPGRADVTMSITGTPGGSSTALLLSNEESGQDALPASNIVGGAAIALTAANTSATVLQNGVWYTPTPTGGSSQSLNITLIAG